MKKYRSLFFLVAMDIIITIFLAFNIRYQGAMNVDLALELSSTSVNDIQVFYSVNNEFSENNACVLPYSNINQAEKLTYSIPDNTQWLRIDFGSTPAQFDIKQLKFLVGKKEYQMQNLTEQQVVKLNMISNLEIKDVMSFTTTGDDGYLVLDLSGFHISKLCEDARSSKEYQMKTVLCVFVNICFLIAIINRKRISGEIKEFLEMRALMFDLARNDFKTRYAGSYLGIIWAFVQPVVTVLVYWFVFQVGFRSGTVKDVPFVLWLASGLVPWFFFNEALNSATTGLLDYAYLVKKVVFNIRIIPVVKIISALFVHIFFVIFIILLFICNGIFPEVFWLQVIYYSFYMTILCLGITYITSALVVFFRDLTQIINVILQIGMWMTPIMWDYTVIPESFRWLFKLNPMYYVVEGYRNALIYKEWFWNNSFYTVYAWIVAIVLLLLGCFIFNKLKEYFADAM